jgi:hypothetical protein
VPGERLSGDGEGVQGEREERPQREATWWAASAAAPCAVATNVVNSNAAAT